MQTLKSEYGVVIEDSLGICTSARTSEKKTIDSPSVATPKATQIKSLGHSKLMTCFSDFLAKNWTRQAEITYYIQCFQLTVATFFGFV